MKFLASTAMLVLAAAAAPVAAQDTASDRFNGFYVGGTVGIDVTADRGDDGFAFDTNRDGSFDNTVRTVAGADAFSPGSCGGFALAPTNTGCSDDDDDIAYSIRAGFDSRLGGGPLVAGIVAEAAKSESRDFVSAFSTTPARYTIERQLDYSFALRGRLGFSPGDGRGLFYVTGGVAYGKMDHEFYTSNGANSFTQREAREYAWGGQVGGGAELYLTNNISLNLEYLYQSYKDDDYFVEVGPGTAPATNPFLLVSGGTNLRAADTNYDLHSLRAGLNLRF